MNFILSIIEFFRKRYLVTNILLHFLSINVFTVFVIISFIDYRQSNIIMQFSRELMSKTSNDLQSDLLESIKTIELTTSIGAKLINSFDELTPKNNDMVSFMIIALNKLSISSLYFSDINKNYLELTRTKNNPSNRFVTEPDRYLPKQAAYRLEYYFLRKKTKTKALEDKVGQFYFYFNEAGQMVESEQQDHPVTDYDITQKSEFKLAAEKGALSWTNVESWFLDDAETAPTIGLTVSEPLFDEKFNFLGAISMDLTLQSFAELVQKNQIPQGISYLVNDKNEVLVSSGKKEAFTREGKKFRPNKIEEMEDPLLTQAYQNFLVKKEDYFLMPIPKGKKYLVKFAKLDHKPLGQIIYYTLIMPLDYFIGDIKKARMMTIYICLFIFLASALIILYLAKQISSPIRSLSSQAERIKRYDLEAGEEIQANIFELDVLQNSISTMRKSVASLSKFVPKKLVQSLVEKGIEIKPGGHFRDVTILFSDIENFTVVSEHLSADKLTVHLSNYFDEFTKIISANAGTVDKYIGDAVMAFWNAPKTDRYHALHACEAALLWQKKLVDLNREWAFEKKPMLKTRIGIHTDSVILGNIGSTEKLNYTILGDGVNLASRLEGTNKFYKTSIIISEKTYHDIADFAVVRPMDIVRVKGKEEPVKIFELIAIKGDQPTILPTEQQVNFSKAFAHAFLIYMERQFKQAKKEFEAIIETFGPDYPCDLFIERCIEYIENPPPKNWDGVTTYKTK